MSTLPLSEFILQSQSVQYAAFDRQWRLISASSGLAELLARPTPPGVLLDELLPELSGMTDSIEASLAKGETVEIDHLARSDWHEGRGYISLQFLTFEGQFILVVRDTSSLGQIEQRLIQKRNELALLTEQLKKNRSSWST